MIFSAVDGATPLDVDELQGLRLSHITTRAELDRWEQENIALGEAWAFSRRRQGLLTVAFMQSLHRRMFGSVWRWAGGFRRSGKNIGIDWPLIPVELKKLCDDTAAWVEYGTYPPDEIAARFHHRLVAIHPFANGNGRHARTMTDLLLVQQLARPRFTWGSANLTAAGTTRRAYIDALRAADRHDFIPLLAFVRS